jgi:hypothetical protein
MELNTFGKITNDCWLDLLNHYQNCWLDEFVIMPDHVHGIVKIKDNTNSELTRSPSVGNGLKPFPTGVMIGFWPDFWYDLNVNNINL